MLLAAEECSLKDVARERKKKEEEEGNCTTAGLSKMKGVVCTAVAARNSAKSKAAPPTQQHVTYASSATPMEGVSMIAAPPVQATDRNMAERRV